jgi:translocation and assembly module TamA
LSLFYSKYGKASVATKLMLLLAIYALPLIEHSALAQKKFIFEARVEAGDEKVLKSFNYKKTHNDSLSAIKELNEFIRAAQSEAFLLASADTFYWHNDTLTADVYLGQPYRWAYLSKGNVPEGLLIRSGFKEKLYRNSKFSYNELVKLEERILTFAENNGYPFARIMLDSVAFAEGIIAAALKYEQGPVIVFDTIRNAGNANIKSRFLARYLRIHPEEQFSQQKLDAAYKLLKQTPYLKVNAPPAAIFSNNRAEVELSVDSRKVNQVDGIIGLLPNEEEKGRMLITGEFNMHLQNLFASGKSLRAHWQKLRTASQRLELEYVHPVFLGSPVEVKGSFSLLKEDTTFLNNAGRISLGYQTLSHGKFSFYTGMQSSRLLSVPVNSSIQRDLSSYDLVMYGLAYDWHNVDDIFYPRRGWRVYAEGAAGNKRLRKPPLEEGTPSFYDSLETQSLQLNILFRGEKFTRLSGRSVLLAAARSGLLVNENLFFNDLFRIGGLNTLRGFNENNFFASRFGVATLEYRFFMEETSYFLLFFDQGYVYYNLPERRYKDYPFGLGAGISFSTPAGIFNFVYSLGKSTDQQLVFSQSKIHFGLTNRF